MSHQDPISDLLTRVRNAQKVNKSFVTCPYSKFKASILSLLVDEGYIESYTVEGELAIKTLIVKLKYYNNQPVISSITRVSKPSLRVYKPASELPVVMNGLGIAIVSTPQGLKTASQARSLNLGGEVVCFVV